MATLIPTARQICAQRGRMTNATRLLKPMSQEHASIVFLDSQTPVDTRRLAAHRLLDIARVNADPMLVHLVTEPMYQGDLVACPGLLAQVACQSLDKGWARWARHILKTQNCDDFLAEVETMRRRLDRKMTEVAQAA